VKISLIAQALLRWSALLCLEGEFRPGRARARPPAPAARRRKAHPLGAAPHPAPTTELALGRGPRSSLHAPARAARHDSPIAPTASPPTTDSVLAHDGFTLR
jgi:hypothetical protein